jgi:hypothetical protein
MSVSNQAIAWFYYNVTIHTVHRKPKTQAAAGLWKKRMRRLPKQIRALRLLPNRPHAFGLQAEAKALDN